MNRTGERRIAGDERDIAFDGGTLMMKLAGEGVCCLGWYVSVVASCGAVDGLCIWLAGLDEFVVFDPVLDHMNTQARLVALLSDMKKLFKPGIR